MPKRILIAPDKFKGTLSAPEATQAIATGWTRRRPEDELIQQPISDGGDGFGPLMAEIHEAKIHACSTVNAAGQQIEANYWITRDGTAIIESANCIGLAMLREDQRTPSNNDSGGLGLMIREAAAQHCNHILIGIGGSATNDGGFGMAHALGWRFLNAALQPINHWLDLSQLERIIPPESSILPTITVAVDVQNPLLGPNGSTRVYGSQKGMRPEMMDDAEAALERMAEILSANIDRVDATLPGAGAAGGLGFGLHCFTRAEIQEGFQVFATAAGLESKLAQADYVITGEGAMDRQTVMGKGVGQLARLARQLHCQAIGLAGVIEDEDQLKNDFVRCEALSSFTSPQEALAQPARWLEALTYQVASEL